MPVTGRLADAVADHRAGPRPLRELPALPGVEVTEHGIPGLPGSPEVRVRVYRPAGAGSALPAVLWIHGGGFVLGNVDSVHHSAAQAASFASAVVVAVAYRLAPEDPFPAGLDDCWAALEWTAGNATEIGADPARLAVAGASSGGCLAAGLALLARDRGGPGLVFQHLSTPVLDDRLETGSMTAYVDTPIWNRRLARRAGSSIWARTGAALPRTPPPRGPGTWAGCPRRTSRPRVSTRCATRGCCTGSAWRRPACRWSCTTSRGRTTRSAGGRTHRTRTISTASRWST